MASEVEFDALKVHDYILPSLALCRECHTQSELIHGVAEDVYRAESNTENTTVVLGNLYISFSPVRRKSLSLEALPLTTIYQKYERRHKNEQDGIIKSIK
jgi:hypothetical protein